MIFQSYFLYRHNVETNTRKAIFDWVCSGEENVLIVMSADAISVAHYWLTYMTNIPAVCWNVTHLSSIFRCLNFARIFTEMSESFTEPIVQFPNRVSSYNIVTRCSDWNKYTFIKERNQVWQLINCKWSSWEGHSSCVTIKACGYLQFGSWIKPNVLKFPCWKCAPLALKFFGPKCKQIG